MMLPLSVNTSTNYHLITISLYIYKVDIYKYLNNNYNKIIRSSQVSESQKSTTELFKYRTAYKYYKQCITLL